MDKLILDANSEIKALQDKLEAMHMEHKNLEQKNHDLVEAFREKSKTQQQIQKLYQSLKAQVMASHVATAATNEAEHTIHAATRDRFVDRIPGTRSGLQQHFNQFSLDPQGNGRNHNRRESGSSGGSGGQGRAAQNSGLGPSWTSQAQNARNWTSQSAPISGTPSQHRSRLPVAHNNPRGSKFLGVDGGQQFGNTPMTRQSLNHPNTGGGHAGYGFGAGMKVGKQSGGGLLSRPAPRVGTAQNIFMR